MTLLLAIPLAWLAVVALTVVLCRAAARGDAEQQRTLRRPTQGRRLAPGLVVWDAGCAGVRTRRSAATGRLSRRRAPA